jgi:TfoX/Sxy family transcriptional regulator of competence genes
LQATALGGSMEGGVMPYDTKLAGRVRAILAERGGVVEKKMFGGLAYMLDGKMFCGIVKDELMVRVGPSAYAAALSRPHVRPMDFTGKPMTGFVFVGSGGTRTAAAISDWASQGAAYIATLPARKARARRPRPRPIRARRSASR